MNLLLLVFLGVFFAIVKSNNSNSSEQLSTIWRNTSEFNIAVIVAGNLRSFVYTFESWKRYIIEPWKGNIYLFAHVIDENPNCPVITEGLKALRSIAITVEVASSVPLYSVEFLKEYLPQAYARLIQETRVMDPSKYNARYIDMFARRARAYELALAYKDKVGISYHAVLLLRLDSAYYEPILPLFQWYENLQYIENTFKRQGLIIPWQCNNHGLCDRQVFGLSHTMTKYLKPTWFIDVLNWSFQDSKADAETYVSDFTNSTIGVNQWFSGKVTFKDFKVALKRKGGHLSMELMNLCWMVMNKWVQVDTTPGLSFLTLRVDFIENYCSQPLREFTRSFKSIPLKQTIRAAGNGGPFDLVGSKELRCGEAAKLANFSYLFFESINPKGKCANTNLKR